MVIESKKYEKKAKPDDMVPCDTCQTYGVLQRNPDFKEPYGYPYRPAVVTCGDCVGLGWIPKYADDKHPSN